VGVHPGNWKQKDVQQWLEDIKLHKYSRYFEKQKCDGKRLHKIMETPRLQEKFGFRPGDKILFKQELSKLFSSYT